MAEGPLVVICLVEMIRGWTPVGDDAAIAWRSFDTFSTHISLVGALTQGAVHGHSYGPGPLQFWLLALPVRIDPLHGALWGSVLLVVAGLALAVEAARRAGGRGAGFVVAVIVVVLLVTQPGTLLNTMWNPYFGVLWLIPTLATAWVVSAGHLTWWWSLVLAASVSAQSHEVFLLPALALVVVAPLGGWFFGPASDRVPLRRWLPAGVAVGVAAWIGPLVQQFTGSPGNVSSLWQQAHGALPRLGLTTGLRALGGAVSPDPSWLHGPTNSNIWGSFLFLGSVLGGSAVWGAALLVLLAVIVVVGWRQGERGRSSASAALVALVAGATTVMVIAETPTSRLLNLVYLTVVLWPIGMALCATLGWQALRLLSRLLWPSARRRSTEDTGPPTRRVRGVPTSAGASSPLVRSAGALSVVAMLAAVVIVAGARQLAGPWEQLGGLSTMQQVSATTALVEEHLPRGQVHLRLRFSPRQSRLIGLDVQLGVGYRIYTGGVSQPIEEGLIAAYIGRRNTGHIKAPWLIVSPPPHQSVTIVTPPGVDS